MSRVYIKYIGYIGSYSEWLWSYGGFLIVLNALLWTAPCMSHFDLQPAGTGTVSGSCSLQLALFTSERQCELRLSVVFSKTCIKKQVCVNWRQFH